MPQIDIKLTSTADPTGINEIRQAVQQLQQRLNAAENSWSGFGRQISSFSGQLQASLGSVMGIGAGLSVGAMAATKLVGALVELKEGISQTVEQGLRLNITLESSKYSFAGVLKQFGGDKFSDFRSSMAESAKVSDLLRQKSIELGLSYPELAEQYRSTVGAMFKGGITDMQKQVEMTVTLKRAMDSLGIQGFQAVRDTADILNGIAKRTMAGRMLQIDDADLKAASDAGTLYDYLQQKLNGISTAANAALQSTESWEQRLANTKANVAAQETENLTTSYKNLLKSINDMDQSPAYRRMIDTWANVKSGFQALRAEIANTISGNSGTSVGAVASASMQVDAFKGQASGVRNQGDVEKALQAGLDLQFSLTSSAKMRTASKETREQLLAMADAVFAEVKALEKEGDQRIKNNQIADQEAKKAAEARAAADKAEKDRQAGVKKFEQYENAEQTAALAKARKKGVDSYLKMLDEQKAALEKQLQDPKASAGYYLQGNQSPTDAIKADADKAARGYRLEITAKIEATEAKIKAAQDEQTNAAVRYLRVKAEQGSVADKVAALKAEENALDKTSLTYAADKLEIENKIQQVKGTAAAAEALRKAREEVAKYDIQLAELAHNPALSDQEKEAKRTTILNNQADAIKRVNKELSDFMAAHPGVDVGGITSAMQSYSEKAARDAGLAQPRQTLEQRDQITGREIGDPAKHYQSASAGMAGSYIQQFAEIGTAGDQIARTFSSVGASIRSSLADAFASIVTTSGSARSKIVAFGNAIGLSFIQNAAKMVADWIYQHAIMATVRRVFHITDVAETTAAEATKTTVTGVGTGARILMTMKETGANLIQAGIKAMTAVASIPYVGPILAIAALGAVIAAGAKLMNGFATGGIVSGGQQPIMVNENGTEAVLNARATSMLGRAGVDALNAGQMLPQITGPAYQPAGSSAGAGGGGAGGGSQGREKQIAFVDYRDHNALQQLETDPRYDTHFVHMMQKHRGKIGVKW